MVKDLKLLKQLCELPGPSGDESGVKQFILDYITTNAPSWKACPEIFQGDGFQDCIILKFGRPKTAVFAHMDTVGFTVRYQNQLVVIGGPDVKSGCKLVGHDSLGPIECELEANKENQLFYKFGRTIDTGTNLTYKCEFHDEDKFIKSCYLDNRLGIYSTLRLAESLENGIIVYSAWEEHGGGSVPYLIRFIYENWSITQALISDITWITDGVHPGKGVVISMRDRNIPRRAFINKILSLARTSEIDFQLEVEGSGSSDGREIQQSPYPIDWCFIGAAEENVHSPEETVHKYDVACMISMYKYLMEYL